LHQEQLKHHNSSTPINFTVFAFHEQEPNSANQQADFLICDLIQVQGPASQQ
jgi:hypothetical protein